MKAIRGSKSALPLRAVFAIALLTLTLGLAACGSDDDDGGKQATTPTQEAPATTAAKPTTVRGQLSQLLSDLQASFIAVDGQRFCGFLTSAGRAEAVRYGRTSGMPGGDCAAVIDKIGRATREAGLKQIKSRILSLRVKGSTAIAIVKDGGPKPAQMRFVKINDQWKLPSPGLEASLGGDGASR